MSSIEIDRLKLAIEKRYGQSAAFSETVHVIVIKEVQLNFDGVVHVFDLAQHPTASRAYAWWQDGHAGSRYHAELNLPPIDSPRAAVEKAIVTRRRNRRERGRNSSPEIFAERTV